jgi:hypothetical protein
VFAPSSCSRLSGMNPFSNCTSMLRILIIIVTVLVAVLVGARLYGAYRRNTGTQELRARLDAARAPVWPQTVDFRELEGLPAPVQRYFGEVLDEGQPMVVGVHVRHTGTFNMGETSAQWKPFTSDQNVIARRPGFDWDGRVAMMPGLPVRVHDAYVAGEGILHASLLGLFPVVDMRGTGDVAEGELMRFFAEAAWHPTALLPSQGVRWEAVDDSSAYATLTEGDISINHAVHVQRTRSHRHRACRGAGTNGRRRGSPDALAGALLELRRARRYAGAARWRGGLDATRRRKA